MEKDPQILLVGPDRNLRAQLESALAALPELRPVVSYQSGYQPGLAATRSRKPEIVLVQMTSDLDALMHFVEEVTVASPDTVVVAVFDESAFGPDVSESAILIDGLRSGIRDFLRRPLSPDDLARLLGRVGQAAAPRSKPFGKVVTFMSTKGGVGKSTMAINVAADIARHHPGRTLLIDASLQMGVCASMLDLVPDVTLYDAANQRDRLDERLVRELTTPHSSGLHLLACPNDAVESSEIDDEIMSRVVQLARRAYDYVIVDTFPMVDRVMTAILDLSDVTYIVAESIVPTIRGVAKTLHLLDQLGFPSLRRRMILNRYSKNVGNLRPADVAKRCGHPVDYIIPYDRKLLVAANLGRPLILDAWRFSSFARAMRPLIDEISQHRPPSASPSVPSKNGRKRGGAFHATPAEPMAQRMTSASSSDGLLLDGLDEELEDES